MAITKHTQFNWLVFIYIQSAIVVSIIAEEKKIHYDCFSDSIIGTCQESRVEISGQFYACDMVMKLNTPPKRIGLKNGEIIYSSEGKSYEIGIDGIQEINKVILPVGELFDEKGNIYYGSDGTSYLFDSGIGKEFEIITTGQFSYNQHACDNEAKKLFILSLTSHENAIEKTGQLYTIATDRLSIVNDKINAELVTSVGDRITALAVQPEAGILVLGLKEDVGGKLIMLKRQQSDPCSQKEAYKATIVNLIKDVENKIASIVSTTSEVKGRSNFKDDIVKENLFLVKDNERLKRNINMTVNTLNMVTDTLKRFSENLHSPKPELPVDQSLSPQEAPPPRPYVPVPKTTSRPRPPPPPAPGPVPDLSAMIYTPTPYRPPRPQPSAPQLIPEYNNPTSSHQLPIQPPQQPIQGQLETILPPPPRPRPQPPPPPPPRQFVTTTLRPTTVLPFAEKNYPFSTQPHSDPSTPRSTYSSNVANRSATSLEPDFDGEQNDIPLNCLHFKHQVDKLTEREKENQRKFDDLLAQLDLITRADFQVL